MYLWMIVFLLIVFLLFKIPVAIALTISAGIGIMFDGIPPISIIQRFYAGTESWVLMAVPFFILAGEIMIEGGLSQRLVSFVNSVFGFLPGGLADVNIAASMLFGGISGSAVADTSAIGSVIIPEMEKNGYSREFAAAVTVASSPIGMIIPPSIPMIVWSFVSSESVASLFLGGVFPGILIGIGLMAVSTFISIKKGYQPRVKKVYFKSIISTLPDGIIALAAPVIIVGGILTGIFTATESAIIAIVYAFVVTKFIYKKFHFRDLPRVMIRAGKISASIMFIIGGATVLSWFMALHQVPQMLGRSVLSIVNSPGQFMLLGSGLLFILGAFLDTSTIILLVGPIFIPIINNMGINPILAALIFLMVLATGLITPPVGLCLFVVSKISAVKIERVAVEVIPFIISMLAVAFFLWIFPEIVTWLPTLAIVK